MTDNFFDLDAQAADGSTFLMDGLRGRVVLVVNTASRCGFTPQYDGLEELHKRYAERGLTVLGFPCDQFGHQEPGSDEEIQEFCRVNHGVTFPVLAKVEVNGEGAHPVFRFLKEHAPGLLGGAVKWNFSKFLVSRDGRTVERFAPITEPLKLAEAIERELAR